MRHAHRLLLVCWLWVHPLQAAVLFQDGFEDGELSANPAWLLSGAGGTATLQSGGRLDSQWALSVGCDGSGNNADVVSTPLSGSAFTVSLWIKQRPQVYPIAQFGICQGAFTDAGRLLQMTVNLHNDDGRWYWNYNDYAGGGASFNQQEIQYSADRWVQVEFSRTLSGAWTLTYDKDGPWQSIHHFQGLAAWTQDPWLWIRGGCYYNPGGTFVDDVVATDDAPTGEPWCDGFESGDLSAWLQQGGSGTSGLIPGGQGGSSTALELSCTSDGNDPGLVCIPTGMGGDFRTRLWIRQRPFSYPILHLGICEGPYSPAGQDFRVTINRHNGDGLWYLNAHDYRDGYGTENQTQISYDDSRWYLLELSRSDAGLWTWVFDKDGPGETTGSHQDDSGGPANPWLFLQAGCYYNPGGSLVDNVCIEPFERPALATTFWLHRRTDTFSGLTTGITQGPHTSGNRTDRVFFGMHDGDMAWHMRMYHGGQALVDHTMSWPGDRWVQVRIEQYPSGRWRTIWDLGGAGEQAMETTVAAPDLTDPNAWFSPIGYYANTGGFYLDDISVQVWDGATLRELSDGWEDGDWTMCPLWNEYAEADQHFAISGLSHSGTYALESFSGMNAYDYTALFTSVLHGQDALMPVSDLAISTLPDLSMRLTWSPVTQTVCGDPAQPEGYVVYYTEQAEASAVYFYLDYAYDTEFIHHRAAEFSAHTFYQVVPHRGANPAALGAVKGMPRAEVVALLMTARE